MPIKYPKPFRTWTTYKGHGGVDYPYATGTPVLAVSAGRITYSGWWNNNAGNTRTLTTPEGVQLMHCHLVSLAGPRVGTWVEPGDVIAYVGNTGRSTGPHLHHEIWVNGVKMSGENYWKYIDVNSTISASSGGSGAGKPNPSPAAPAPIIIPKEESMIPLYITDDCDGNGKPGWALFNTNTGNWVPLVNDGTQAAQENANSWGRVLGRNAQFCTRQDALNVRAGIIATK